MTCRACEAAKSQPDAEMFSAGCMGCDARALAVTRVDLLGRRAALEAIHKVFGENAGCGEQLVREWIALLRQRKAAP